VPRGRNALPCLAEDEDPLKVYGKSVENMTASEGFHLETKIDVVRLVVLVFVAGLATYLRCTRAVDRTGAWTPWAFVALLVTAFFFKQTAILPMGVAVADLLLMTNLPQVASWAGIRSGPLSGAMYAAVIALVVFAVQAGRARADTIAGYQADDPSLQ
jgi:hypothetical protein